MVHINLFSGMRRRDIILMHMLLLGIQYNNFIIVNIVITTDQLVIDRSPRAVRKHLLYKAVLWELKILLMHSNRTNWDGFVRLNPYLVLFVTNFFRLAPSDTHFTCGNRFNKLRFSILNVDLLTLDVWATPYAQCYVSTQLCIVLVRGFP